MENYPINNIYQGGYSSFKNYPNLSPEGYPVMISNLGMASDPRTANILKDISEHINVGTKTIEISQVDASTFQSIPIGHLKEVNRLAKLTGIDVTLHAPVVEPSGMSQQGFDESQRKVAERQMMLAMERANELNPKKSSPVTFHSSVQIPGTKFKPTKDGKTEELLIAVDRETGQLAPLKEDIKYYPHVMKDLKPEFKERISSLSPEAQISEVERWDKQKIDYLTKIPLEKGKTISPVENLKVINESKWDNSINQVFFNKERADEILQKEEFKIKPLLQGIAEKRYNSENFTPEQRSVYNKYLAAGNYLHDVHQQINGLFSKAYEFGDENNKKDLKNFSEEFQKQLKEDGTLLGQSKAMQELIIKLKTVSPELYISVEKFALDKTAETFSNVALHSYKEFKESAPIVSIENPPHGSVLSTGEDLKDLVEETRKRFVKKAVEEKLMSESQAKKQAEKLIGVTWDVGHINMMRKEGFGKEEVVKQSEAIKPYLKHIHLSDNFGLDHTELPMGMGNVPIKEIMGKLGQEGFDAKKIIEAGNWWQHFSPGGKHNSPFKYELEAFGSPLYSDGAPYWNQTLGFQQGYSGGMAGNWLPQVNYETFGAGFAQLPAELGGQKPGAQGGRMGGRQLE